MDVVDILSHVVAEHLHLIAFGLLLLSGFNVPISEDLVFIASASIAAAIIPENVVFVIAGIVIVSALMIQRYFLRAKRQEGA